MLFQYIGLKAVQRDTQGGTSLVWNGTGDIQNVDDPKTIEKMLKHPTVWRVVSKEDVPESVPVEPAIAPVEKRKPGRPRKEV